MRAGLTLMMWAIAIAACGGDVGIGPGGVPQVRQCDVTPSPNFPVNGSVHVDRPALCPVQLQFSTQIPYGGTVRLPSPSNVLVDFYDNNGGWNGFLLNGAYRVEQNVWITQVTGEYLAGRSPQPSQTRIYEDRAVHIVGHPDNAQSATAHLTYQWGVPAYRIIAPAPPEPYTTVQVYAETGDPFAQAPVSYRWWRNGVRVVGATTSELSFNSGSPGETHDIALQAIDGRGVVYSGNHSMTTRDQPCEGAGCMDQ